MFTSSLSEERDGERKRGEDMGAVSTRTSLAMSPWPNWRATPLELDKSRSSFKLQMRTRENGKLAGGNNYYRRPKHVGLCIHVEAMWHRRSATRVDKRRANAEFMCLKQVIADALNT